MYLLFVENARLSALVKDWQKAGSNPQEGFDWSRSRANWQRDLPKYSGFISKLPQEIDRANLRSLVANTENSDMEKFLSVMIWGYGDLGYGSHRVKKMFSTVGVENMISQVFHLCQDANPLMAYDFLKMNRITQLGPAFGTKVISFFTPREIVAPIYDSFISKWMGIHEPEVFEGKSCSSKTWNRKVYSSYLNWVAQQSRELGCFGDDIELVIFRDALAMFDTSSRWAGQ